MRPYQREAVEAVLAARRDGVRRMVLALPTGAGKTVIFSELIRRARHPVLVLAHRDELIEQARDKIERALRADPQASAHGRRLVAIERGAAKAAAEAWVIVASIRTLHEGRIGKALGGRGIRLVVYDECHHAVADANRRVLEQVGVFAPDWPGTLIGFTATTRRADGRGLGEVFEKIVYTRSLRQMIDDGYLRPLRGLRIDTGHTLGAIPMRGDDFEPEALEADVDVQDRNVLVARAIQECARDRRTIAFCVGVGHAENLCRALRSLGTAAAMVCGEMPKADRARTLRRFREGEIDVITNVGVLTEGFDDPGVSAIAMVRPTRSESMYLQCVGRGMRLSPDAADCLVLDFVDLSSIEIVTAPTLDAGPRPTPMVREPQGDEDGGHIPVRLEDGTDDEAPATLAEIEARLAAFDPLVLSQGAEAASISPNAWVSLGTLGMLLHFEGHDGGLRCFEVRPAKRKRAEVWLDDARVSSVPSVLQGVEAVDHELPRYGDPTSAQPHARWRLEPVPAALAAAVSALQPPRVASTVADALAHLAFAQALTGHAR